jgi:tRNA pseudouridine55 synthase
MTVDGVLVIDKPVGPTSHDIVAAARRALRLRRVGHTGTLDPQASGVLPLVVGQATRLAQYLSGADKEYDAVIRFGVETDTYDRAGKVVRETREVPARDRLAAALERFRGCFAQLPPPFSAKKRSKANAPTCWRGATNRLRWSRWP